MYRRDGTVAMVLSRWYSMVLPRCTAAMVLHCTVAMVLSRCAVWCTAVRYYIYMYIYIYIYIADVLCDVLQYCRILRQWVILETGLGNILHCSNSIFRDSSILNHLLYCPSLRPKLMHIVCCTYAEDNDASTWKNKHFNDNILLITLSNTEEHIRL